MTLVKTTKEKKMKNLKLIAIISLMTLSVAACNTVEGVGQDVERLGNGIEDSAS